MTTRKARIAFFLSLLCAACCAQAQDKLSQYVDPFIGTGGHGHTFPGAAMPFGMVQLSPDTYNREWDWCSGYHESDSSIMGFSHTHLSGTGCGDYGDILFMPTTGAIKLEPGSRQNPTQGYRSRFKKENEQSTPGYYSVYLDDHKVKVELTATTRAGYHKYTFPETNEANIIIDLEHGIDDHCTNAQIKMVSDTEVEGYRQSSGWNKDHTVYFFATFSKPFLRHGIALDGEIDTLTHSGEGNSLKAFVRYETKAAEVILVRVGISHVSVVDARKNLKAEIANHSFDEVKAASEESWEKELSKILVEGGSKEQRVCFYTALYHSLLTPNIFQDIDGHYKGMDGKIYTANGSDIYSVFSLWDTFRALNPLLTIIEPERAEDMVNSLYLKYREFGMLPLWELAAGETNCMIGYPSVPVIFDAYRKGLVRDSVEAIYSAMVNSAEHDQFGVIPYSKYGYLPADKMKESVSRTLEYAYEDWCIAMMAKSLGKAEDFQNFSKRALYYRNLFDGSTGFMRGKIDNAFVSPFNPFAESTCYTESNAWQYNLFVPHDVSGLINLFGSDEHLSRRLDELFTARIKVNGREQPEKEGYMGQYAHDNEPSHHLAYLYNYVGQGWKTQEKVREIMEKFYSTKRDGLAGNDDCGQTSAWYVFSAIGMYPVCPGTSEYVIGSPIFTKVTIQTGNGKCFMLNAPNSSPQNKYVRALTRNHEPYQFSYIRHEDIVNGGEFTFDMNSVPEKTWASIEAARPYSFNPVNQVSPPFQTSGSTIFLDSATVSLSCQTKGAQIFYSLDGSTPTIASKRYSTPLTVTMRSTLKAIASKDGWENSPILTLRFEKAELKEATSVTGLKPGLTYRYFEGQFSTVAELSKAEAKKTGIAETPSLQYAQRTENFGISFSGYIRIPTDGLFTFSVISDDGGIVYIDDQPVANNDGSHGATLATGTIALQTGYHAYRLVYFQGAGPSVLEAGIEGPDLTQQTVPKEMFFSEH